MLSRFLALSLVSLTCSAQLPVVPVALSPTQSPINQNLAYYWNYLDISSNTAVTAWVDRIQGAIWANGASANNPTNSFNGIWTDESHWLTNAGLTTLTNVSGSNTAFCIVVNIINQGDSPYQLQPAWISNGNETTGSGKGFGFYDTGSNPHGLSRELSPVWLSFGSSSFQGTNRWIDILFNEKGAPSGGFIDAYTNGVLVQDISQSGAPYFFNTIPINYLGRNAARASGPRILWKEIRIYTNTLSASTIAALHVNAQNLGVTP